MPFVSVNHPIFGDFNSEFGDVYEWLDAGEEIVVSPETFWKSVFVQDIGHSDEVGVALPVSHQVWCLVGTVWS